MFSNTITDKVTKAVGPVFTVTVTNTDDGWTVETHGPGGTTVVDYTLAEAPLMAAALLVAQTTEVSA